MSGVSWKIVKPYIVLFVQISPVAWKKSSQTYGFIVGAIFFSNAKDEFLRKGQWSFRTYGESSWKDFEPSTEPGLNVWMKFFGITRRRTHFSSLYSDFLVLLRIGAVPHLWSRQTCPFLINLKLRVRFFPKIPDQIKNPNHKDFSLRKETMYPNPKKIIFHSVA